MTRMLYTSFWPVIAYVLGLAQMTHDLHPGTVGQVLAVISLPLFPAIIVFAILNRKSMKPHQKKYFAKFAVGLALYALGIDVANHLHAPPTPYNYLLILLPVLPLIYVCTVIIRYIADADEMWRKIYMEAWAFSGIATGFTCFSYLFLRDMGAPEFRPEWAFYIMWIYYGIGAFFSWRRYK